MGKHVREHASHVMRLLALLHQVVGRVDARHTPTGGRLGLTNLQMAVLASVYLHGEPAMSEVAADQLVHRPAATRLVNELVARKLIVRAPDPHDRRSVRLRLTPKGRATVDRVHAEAAVLLERVLRHMTAEEQSALFLGVESFIRAVTALEAGGEL
jgi:DNA-binding MarR family transcriptional regulator